jgi:hypothetical protein
VSHTTTIAQGKVYLDESHVSLLRAEPEYVKKRYQAARTLYPFGVTRQRAAEMMGRSKRQLQRVIRRFRKEGILGLRFRSKRPHTMPRNKTPLDIERRVMEVREATGFGADQLAAIVNESLALEGRPPTQTPPDPMTRINEEASQTNGHGQRIVHRSGCARGVAACGL